MKRFFSFSYLLPIIISIVLFISCKEDTSSSATTETATDQISGVVTDAQGLSVPMADVQLIDDSSKVYSQTSSDEDGVYTIANPPSKANLKLKISHPDYKIDYENIEKFPNKKNCPISIYRNDSCCGKIDFSLLDSNTNAPLGMAEIRINKNQNIYKKIKTNDLGKAEFLNVCPGIYSIRISKENYKVFETIVSITNCDSVKVIKKLLKKDNINGDTCCNNKIKIIARDSATGLYLKGANIRITNQSFIQVLENKDGGVLFNNICSGLCTIRITKEGYNAQEFAIKLNCSDSIYFAKYLSKVYEDSCCNAKIRIFARDSSNNTDLTNYSATLYQNNLTIATKSSSANPLIFEHLCPGKYSYTIKREGFKARDIAVEVSCNENKESSIKMLKEIHDTCCNNIISVRVKDSSASLNINEALVKLWKDNTVVKDGKTNSEGRLVLTGICSGTYTITMSKDGFNAKEFNLTINCGDSINFEKLLTYAIPCSSAKLSLAIKDKSTNSYLQGADVKIYNGQTLVYSTSSPAKGNVIKEALTAPATYRVEVSKNGYISSTREFKFDYCKVITETISLEK